MKIIPKLKEVNTFHGVETWIEFYTEDNNKVGEICTDHNFNFTDLRLLLEKEVEDNGSRHH